MKFGGEGIAPRCLMAAVMGLSTLLLVSRAGNVRGEDPGVARAPVRDRQGANLGIPPFEVWHRVYLEQGQSHFKKYRVESTGALTLVADFKGPTAAYMAMQKEREGIPGQLAPRSMDVVSPGGQWEFLEAADGTDGWGTVIVFRDRTTGRQDRVEVHDDAGLFFGVRPWFWSADGSFLYLIVNQGPTGGRNLGLLRCGLADRSFLKVGDCTDQIARSVDGRWIIWAKYGGLVDVGGKRVSADNLMVFDTHAAASYQLTRDTEYNFLSLSSSTLYEYVSAPPATRGAPLQTSPVASPELIAALKDPDPTKRAIAAESLGRLRGGAAEAIPALIVALGDAEWWVRAKAASAMAEIALGARQAAKPALPALFVALRDQDPRVQRPAGEAIQRIGAARSDVPALLDALRGGDAAVRREAVSALAGMGPDAEDAVPVLVELLGDRGTAGWAWTALGNIGKAAIPALAVAVQDKRSMVRLNAVVACDVMVQSHPDQVRGAIPLLKRALRDDNDHIQETARRVLGRIDELP